MAFFFFTLKEKIDQVANSRWAPWIIFLVALTTRAIGVALGGVNSDDGDHTYERYARSVLAGQGLSLTTEYGTVYSWLPPGMGVFNIPFFYFFGDQAFLVERWVIVVMSSLAAVALVYAARRFVGKSAAWMAGLLWAIYPAQWFWATRVNAQPVATNLVVFCLLLLFQSWEKPSHCRAFVVGVLWVAASMCRGEYTLGIFVLAGVTLFMAPSLASRKKLAALLVLGWVVGFAPWVIRNYKIHHRFVLVATNDGYNFWKSYNDQYDFRGEDIPLPPDLLDKTMKIPNEVDRSDFLKQETMTYIRSHPGRTAYIVLGNALNFWRPWLARTAASKFQNSVYLLTWTPVFILFLVGLFLGPWKNPAWLSVVGLIAYKFGIHIFFYLIVRYREAIFPLIALVAVVPLDRWLRDKNQVSPRGSYV